MKILALAKQVPATTDVKFGADGTMARAGLPGTVNPDDAAAVELAIQWAEATGGEAVVATMGPAGAEEMLGELAAMGCAEAWHLCDDALKGADALLTAKALAALARRLEADAVVTGAVAADGQTGAVPALVAGLLGVAHAGNITALESVGDALEVRQRRGVGEALLRVTPPAVVAVFKTVAEPRIPDVMAVLSAPAPETLGAGDLGLTEADLAWGDRAEIISVEPVAKERRQQVWEGAESLPELLAALAGEGF